MLFEDMDGFISSKTICEALNNCSPLGMTDYLKIIWGRCIGLMKCAVTAQIKDKLWYLL
jgi:hypothetical protein